ncbi:MAG: hypothetical protein KGP35_02235 [Bacteroidetes bacterium]|nr:hypothetical protein [Bacteroidota bacterium]
MKNSILLSVFFVMAVISCRKPQDPPPPSRLISGNKFKVHQYVLNGQDNTAKFANSVLYFQEDGRLELTQDGKVFSGSWEEYSDPPKLSVEILTNNNFLNLLSREWLNDLLNPTRVKLVDELTSPQHILILDLIQ